jgi:hypothetical protein
LHRQTVRPQSSSVASPGRRPSYRSAAAGVGAPAIAVVEKSHAGRAQAVGGRYPTPAVDGGEKLLMDCHI